MRILCYFAGFLIYSTVSVSLALITIHGIETSHNIPAENGVCADGTTPTYVNNRPMCTVTSKNIYYNTMLIGGFMIIIHELLGVAIRLSQPIEEYFKARYSRFLKRIKPHLDFIPITTVVFVMFMLLIARRSLV